MIRLAQVVLLAIIASSVFLPCPIATSGTVVLSATLLFFITTLLDGRISLIAVFVAAFAYMVPPEAILFGEELSVKWGVDHVVVGWRVLVLSFVAVCIGFLLFRRSSLKNTHSGRAELFSGAFQKSKLIFGGITVFLCVLFSPMIIYGMTTGRGSASLFNPEDGGGLLFNVGPGGYFLASLCYAVCSFWGYYFSKQGNRAEFLFKAIIYSLPILLIGVASGTRYMLCFMLACLFLPWVYQLNIKKLKWIGVGAVFAIVLFSAMKNSRNSGFDLSTAFNAESSAGTLIERIVSNGSPEGLIRNMAMIDLWTETHSHTYGKSIGFLGIFWIPRVIWNDKPVQLDYWLIREYESGFGGGHSTASSFCGELFMDFGYFCILICFFLGGIMAKMDCFIEKRLIVGGFVATALSGVMLGWAFFMTRSILTASYPLVLGLPVIWFLNKAAVRELPPPPIVAIGECCEALIACLKKKVCFSSVDTIACIGLRTFPFLQENTKVRTKGGVA
ncbi:MAG: oligosaccharide repeat unit polymerase [Verrucomicrobia bacterium]|nr:oligosaccharide repeat unit polymerase [Verrucomicrobiota bacterium]